MCFSDSLHVVQLVKEGTSQFHHTFSKGNAYADVLAKLGATNVDPLIVLQEPPSSLPLALLADARGVSFVRT